MEATLEVRLSQLPQLKSPGLISVGPQGCDSQLHALGSSAPSGLRAGSTVKFFGAGVGPTSELACFNTRL